jgi:hypothetical protein
MIGESFRVQVLSTSAHVGHSPKYLVHFFDKGCFITLKSNYIHPLHNQEAHSRFVVSSQKYDKKKLGEILIGTINHMTPKV